MNKHNKNVLLLTILGVLIGAGAVWIKINHKDAPGYALRKLEPASGYAANKTKSAVTIGGSFTLIDHYGNDVTQDDYADFYKLVFFGFTNCPDICPTGLQKIASALDTLGDRSNVIHPLFISVDPARDTPEIMKEYVEMFSPRLIGLTGTKEQVKQAEEAYKVYAAKVEGDTEDSYTMNHSTYIFFMNPQGEMIELFSSNDSIEKMVLAIEKNLSH